MQAARVHGVTGQRQTLPGRRRRKFTNHSLRFLADNVVHNLNSPKFSERHTRGNAYLAESEFDREWTLDDGSLRRRATHLLILVSR